MESRVFRLAPALVQPDVDLLQAALTSGNKAKIAYSCWREQLDWDTIPARWQRLLPLLHQNLTQIGVDDPLLERMKGVRRYMWAKNLRLIALAKNVIAEFSKAGIDTLTLKGTSLVASGYVDRSIRPMDDIDLLLQADQIPQAVGVLKTMGIEPRFMRPASLLHRAVPERIYSGWPFANSGSDEVDIHWSAMHLDRRPDSDRIAWSNSRVVTFEGQAMRVLDPTEQLINICAHGARDSDSRSIRWIADAVLVVQKAEAIDWAAVVERARYHRLSAVMARGLDLIRMLFDLPIDERSIQQLYRQSTWAERTEIRAWGRPPEQWKRGISGQFLAVQEHARGKAELFDAPFLKSAARLLVERTGAPKVASALLRLLYFSLGAPANLRKVLASDRHLLRSSAEGFPAAGDMDFARQDCPEQMFLRGWSIGELSGRWTDGPSATLLLRLAEPRRVLPTLRLHLLPSTNVENSAFTLSVYVNDVRVTTQRLILAKFDRSPIVCPGPICDEPTSLMVITFEMADLKSPGVGATDPRTLGVLLSRIELVDPVGQNGPDGAVQVPTLDNHAIYSPSFSGQLENKKMTETNSALLERLNALEDRVAELEDGQKSLQSAYSRTRANLRRLWMRPPMWTFEQYLPRVLDLKALPTPLIAQNASPSIAIVTPSYNQGRFLAATIESVLDQNYPNLKFHVQDGNSTDESARILESYGSRLSWKSVPDDGQSDAINRGFATIDADIMAYLNSDDTLLPGTLAYVANFFSERPEVDIVYGHRIFIDREGFEIGRAVLPPHNEKALLYAGYVPQETMFWRRKVWDQVGGMDTSFHYALDWDFMIRAQTAGFKFARAPRFLACFRVHDEQKTTKTYDIGRKEMALIRRRYLGYNPNSVDMSRAMMPYLIRQFGFHWAYKLNLLNTNG